MKSQSKSNALELEEEGECLLTVYNNNQPLVLNKYNDAQCKYKSIKGLHPPM